MKKAAIYIRVSTFEQASEGYSISGQENKLISYCKIRNWDLLDTYIDAGYTGTNMKRPELQRLLKDLDKIDIVLVYKLDRLSRNQRDILYLVEEKFMINNIDFVSIMENFDTSTPFGRAMLGILAVFAQLERDTIVERTKLGKERRAEEGYWNGGPNPIGYDLVDGRLIVNKYEAVQIKKIFDLYKKHGQNKTAKIMNKNGYKTKYGKWHGPSIKRIVNNPIYTGKIIYRNNIYKGEHDPIISEEDFKKIQEIINERTTNKVRKSKYLLGGLLWCGHCGARLKSNWSSSGKNGAKFYYYVCYSVSKRPIHMVKDFNCPGKFWKMEELDNYILDKIKNIELDKSKIIYQYNDYYKEQSNDSYDEICILQNEIRSIDKQTNKLIDLYKIDKLPVDAISEKLQELQIERNNLEKNINKLNKDITKAASTVSLEKILKIILDNFHLIWEEASFQEKRVILTTLIKKIIVSDTIKIEWNE